MTITITKAEYDELLLDSNRYEMLLDALYNYACLSWNEKYLGFDNEKVCDLLKLIDRFDYTKKYNELKGVKKDETQEEK